MATLTGQGIANSYKDLLQVSNSNSGVDGTLRTIQDGEGTNSALQLSNSTVNVNGTLQVGGVALTATISALNAAADITGATGMVAVSGGTAYGRTLTAGLGMTVGNGDGTEGNPTFAITSSGVTSSTYGAFTEFGVNVLGQIVATSVPTSVSIAVLNASSFNGEYLNLSSAASITGNIHVAGTATFDTIVSASTLSAVSIYATKIDAAVVSVDQLRANSLVIAEYDASLSNFTANHVSVVDSINIVGSLAATSAAFSATVSGTTFNASTAITVAGNNVATSTGLAALSATMATSIANVSVLTKTNTDAVTSINSVVGTNATNIAAVSVLTSVNLAATTSITGRITTLSATMATSIGTVEAHTAAVSVLTGTNLAATTSITGRITTLSATMATSIGTVNTAIAAVSVLTGTNLAATTSITGRITALSAAIATSIGTQATNIAAVSVLTGTNLAATTSITGRITTLSATMATSIATTRTAVSAVSATMATSIANHLPLTGGTLTGPAIGDFVSLTDAAIVSVDFSLSQNFHLTLAGNRTLANPNTATAPQVGSIFVAQDGTGGRTLSFGTSWEFPGGTAPTLSTSINAVDRIDYIVRTSTAIQSVATLEYT